MNKWGVIILFAIILLGMVTSYLAGNYEGRNYVIDEYQYRGLNTIQKRINVTEYSWFLGETKVNGFYNYDGYFCVKTSGRTREEIAATTFHELSHYFVHQDYDHFIKEPEGYIIERRD